MLTYIYFVKCPGCEDEHFDFFNDAKDFALGCLSKKPIITQTEVDRNDFGECTDSCDLGTVWSWEDMMETEDTPAKSIFTKDDLKHMVDGQDPEFDALDDSIEDDSFSSVEDAIDFLVKDEEEAIAGYEKVEDAIEDFDVENKKEILDTIDHIKEEEEEHIEELKAAHERKSIPEGMTIEQLVEEMEENEDEVECKWCGELFGKDQCRKEVDLGWLCDRCQAAIKSRGESLTFREGGLDEAMDPRDLVELEYPSLTVTLYGPKRDADDWDEVEYTDSHVFLVPKVEVATAIWENWITEEDAKDVKGGLETLDDDVAWEKFLETHFDDLFEKYNKQILEYFKDEATEDFRERSQEEYQMNNLAADMDHAYDEWRDEKYFGESYEALSEDYSWIKAGDRFRLETKDGVAHYVVVTTYDKDLQKNLKKEERYLCVAKENPDGTFAEQENMLYDWLAKLRHKGKFVFESISKPFLEEFDDAETHKARLIDCPECGSVSYDMKEQYCTNCGLNL